MNPRPTGLVPVGRPLSLHCVFRIIVMAAFALRLSAQAPARDDPAFHVSVNLVQVDAVVTDSKGHPVRGLEPNDFEILEDGKPETITHFSWIDVSPPAAASNPARRAAPSGTVSLPPVRTAAKEDIRRAIVLMVDDAGTSSEDQARILSDMRRFVTDQLQPGDVVAVTASRDGMGFYSRFTSDKRQLREAIDHIPQRRGWLICDYVSSNPMNLPGLPWQPPDPRTCNPRNPVGYLTRAIQGLHNMPGRKAVVLFTRSFAAPPALVDLANRAGVVIYVMDPFPWPVSSYEPARKLAQQTGGLFIDSMPGKDLAEDLGRVLEDMSGYYLIGYQPERSDFDLVKEQPVHHQIQVKVRRAGLTVRARNGFMGVSNSIASAGPQPQTTHDYLQAALASPFNPGTLRVHIDPLYGASAPNPKTQRRQAVLRTMLQVDGSDLKFGHDAEGHENLTYSVLTAVFNQDGIPVASREHTFRIAPTPKNKARLASSGLPISMDFMLPAPGAYQVWAAVRDENSGDVGSAYSFLEVPDFNQPRLTLSSIELSSPRSSSNDNLSSLGRYSSGATVEFNCDVFGIRNARPPSHEPRVEMEIRLFRDEASEPVFDSGILPVSAKTLADNYVAGQMTIGRDIAPGDYMMQLIVYDRLAPEKKQAAVQWTNLTVVKPD